MTLRIKRFTPTLDLVAIMMILLLSVVIGFLLWGGNNWFHTGPRVRDFSWQGKNIGADDTAFIITFNRPMDRFSVEEHLKIDPPLPGKLSWMGRRMAYTLDQPAPYGEQYQVNLEGARERFVGSDEPGEAIQSFKGIFSTRDRAFTYIGVEGDETGRLVLYNLTQQKKTILTPRDLVVTNSQFYPEGDRVLFSAVDRRSWRRGQIDEKIYRIPTGLNPNAKTPNGLELVLDNKDFRNLKFDLSQDGERIVIQRVNRRDPADFGLWVVNPNGKAELLENIPGSDFLIAPDSETLAVAQGEGMAIVPLEERSTDPLDFLPQFGQVLSFSRDGAAAAMVNFNTDQAELRYTRSLYLVTNQDVQKELLITEGSIIDCQFNSRGTNLYCILTELEDGDEYIERPYLAAIDLRNEEILPLATFPGSIDVQMTLAPDGVALLFDQVISDANYDDDNAMRANSGEAILTSRMWLVPIDPIDLPNPETTELVELPLPGFRPHWSP